MRTGRLRARYPFGVSEETPLGAPSYSSVLSRLGSLEDFGPSGVLVAISGIVLTLFRKCSYQNGDVTASTGGK